MITQLSSDPLSETAVSTDLAGVDAASIGASQPSSGTAHPRIHRIAGMVHQGIDKIQQTLGSTGQGVADKQGRYGQQARHYADGLRERINAQPLQSAGIALGAGVVLSKLFGRGPKERVITRERLVKVPVVKERVVQVPAYAPSAWTSSGAYPEVRARRWMDSAGSGMERVAGAGRQAVDRSAEAAGAGIAGTAALASTLARKASTLPLELRQATQRLWGRSLDYGSVARSRVQEAPAIGIVGAGLGIGALLGTLWLQRRPRSDRAYVTAADASDTSLAADRSGSAGFRGGATAMISSRPVTSAVLVLGLGALAGAMLRRR